MKGKLKKWLLPLLVVLAVMVPLGSASASGTKPLDGLDLTDKHWVQIEWSGGGSTYNYIEVAPTATKFYKNGSNISANGAFVQYEWRDGIGWISGTSYPSGSEVGFTSVIGATADVYADSTLTTVFFSGAVTAPELPETAGVDQPTLEALGAVLSQHGMTVLLGALVILTLMLGISLAPRLVRYLAR